ncbi:MAG: GHKL domain-containing protein, partial [Pirellulales bacterium]|nr:GHKL domain-containing protein [Pirellulales bacterium]
NQRGVSVEIAKGLPTVFGDRQRLLEVLQNLVDNAAKFMGDQPDPRIEITARTIDNEVVCLVHDNGVGVEPRYHQRIFGLFDKLSRDTEGSGVGLAMIKRIVEVHDGRVWVESEGEGRGSTFGFAIPCRKPEAHCERILS